MTNKATVLDEAAGIEDPARVAEGERPPPDPEVLERARRRTFTARYKLEVLVAYEAAADGGQDTMLRWEGLHSSHITHGGVMPATLGRWPCRVGRPAGTRAPRSAGGADRPVAGRAPPVGAGTGPSRFVVDAPATTPWFAKSHKSVPFEPEGLEHNPDGGMLLIRHTNDQL